MKRQMFIKFIICILICIGIAIVSNCMPQFMPAVYDSIFQTTIDVPVFMFVIGLIIFEIFLLRKGGIKSKWQRYVCLGVAFITASLMLFSGHTNFLYDRLMPSSNTILLNRSADISIFPGGVFMQYYFDDKNLIISEEENVHKELPPSIYQFSVPPQNIIVDEEITISEEIKNVILSQPYYSVGQYCFVIDEYWENADSIRVVCFDEEYIFCTQKFLTSVQDSIGQNGNVTSICSEVVNGIEEDDAVFLLGEMEQNKPYRKFKHIMVMLLLLVIGLAFTLAIWGENYPILAFFLGLPVAFAGICIYGIVLMILNIPFNFYTIFGGSVLFGGICLHRNINVYRKLNWKLLLNFMLAAIGVITFLVYAEVCHMMGDSIVKCAMAYRLAKFGTLRDMLVYVAPYGMLEPMVMSIGYMIRSDLLYTFYPLMIISGGGIMYAGIYYSDKKINLMSILALGCGIILLMANHDFLLSGFWIMSHGSIAVYTLIFVVFVIMKRQVNIAWFEEMVTIVLTIILVTRVEGALYVLFMLVAAMGIENENLKMKKSNIIMAVIIVVWNVYQMIYSKQGVNTYFWRADRGILLIGASIVVLIGTLLMDQRWKILEYIRKYYFLIFMTVIIGMGSFVAVFLKRSLASVDFPIYVAHFFNNPKWDNNSASLWIFVLLIWPVILSMRKRISGYALTTVVGYIILIFVIVLFRNDGALGGDLPLHADFTDSARRMIVHIMPTAVWLSAYCTGESERFIEKGISD